MVKCDPVLRQRWKPIISFRKRHAPKCHNFIKKLDKRLTFLTKL
jgi:hypothetical protein